MACITSLPAFCGVVGRVHVHLCGFVVCDLGIRIEFLLCSGKGLSAGEPADFSHALLNDFRFASLNGKIALEKCHFFFLWITVLSNEIAGVSGELDVRDGAGGTAAESHVSRSVTEMGFNGYAGIVASLLARVIALLKFSHLSYPI